MRLPAIGNLIEFVAFVMAIVFKAVIDVLVVAMRSRGYRGVQRADLSGLSFSINDAEFLWGLILTQILIS